MNNQIGQTIKLNISCALKRGQQDAFAALLNELVSITIGADVSYLRAVYIVADGSVEETANMIIRDVAGSSRRYTAGPNPASAIAVPVGTTDGFGCYIVLAKHELHSLTSVQRHPHNLTSSLLEELLHVRVYTHAWRRRGTIAPPITDRSWRDDLFVLCTLFHDEYIVGRTKSALMSTTPLVDNGDKMSTCSIFYPYSLAPILQQAHDTLAELVTKAAAGTTPTEQAWSALQAFVYRDIFEPLARDAAFRDGNTDESPIKHNASENRFYREIIKPFWLAIYKELDRSFSSDLVESDVALDLIGDVLESFLARIGVTFRQQIDGSWWVWFDESAFPVLK
jgi:hypothetical protein